MLHAVSNALSGGQHLMVEAGTGVGKSFAYLIPAALFAMQNNTRVLVSTNTINLQDQLIKKDLPDLRAALGLDLRAAVLKGRSNYLCPRRLHYMRQHGPANEEELRVLAKILVWQLSSASGDRSEINLTGPSEREVWSRISAEDDNCTNDTCLGRMAGSCPFYRARQAAASAHVLIVNHALLLSDIATGSKVLPEYSYVIVDEAHHMEAATTNALSFRLTQFDMDRLTREVGGSSAGVLGRLLTAMQGSLRPSDFGLLQQKVKRATDQAFRVEQLIKQFFTVLGEFASDQREGQATTNYSWQLRIIPAIRTLASWEQVEVMWGEADETMGLLLKTLGELYKDVASLYSDGHENLEEIMSTLSNLYRRMTEAEAAANGLISNPATDQIYWVEVNPRGDRLSLNAAPLRVGPLVQKYLWHEKASVILTSATITTHGEFQYVRNTLSADEADELMLGSPFDYESSTLLYIANDIPEPNVQGYQQALDRGLVQLARATGGRMLVLFTSYTALKKTAQAITRPLADADIYVFEQGEGASPNALLESFRASEHAVLLGTRAFWEGVDVPGDALSVVVLTKLPFDVPSDPLIAARSELYEDPFNEYYLPEAILKFRQGFGRLIRTASDRGIVAIFDRRVLTKQYGRLFLESLPQCTSRQGPVSNLPKMAAQWLGL
jgi:DNA polymerase-3 subunit epsilon/ATP-dependent DNA helicase DinG